MGLKKVEIPESYKYIAAFLTMRCNLNCDFCLNAFGKNFERKGFKESSGEQWVESLNRLEGRLDLPATLSGGEPFLHKDFIYIINNVDNKRKIDILTNLQWGKAGVERFIEKVNPERLKREAKYASIRASYHPEQMDASILVENAKKLQDSGFSIGIWAVLYPSPEQLQAITQMQFRCRDAGIDFRLKDFTGSYNNQIYGNYSKHPRAAFESETKKCLCKTSELLIGTNLDVYRCHRDLYSEQNSAGNLRNSNFKINTEFHSCNNYGNCHPCDVKVKTDYKQELGYTSVDIKDIC